MKAFPVTVLCAVMKVSRSGFYDYLYSRSLNDGNSPGETMLAAKIKEIFIEHKGSYGSRRIVRDLKNQGYPIGRFKVRRILR
jgi:transposase InsO family protein